MTAWIDSPLHCPHDGKRLVMQIGADDVTGRGDLTVRHECLHCPYFVTGPSTAESARRTSPTVAAVAAENLRLRRLSGFSRDVGVEVPLRKDVEVADVHDLSDACWWDRCDECRRQWCEHKCHDEQEWDFCHDEQEWDFTAREWVLKEEADAPA